MSLYRQTVCLATKALFKQINKTQITGSRNIKHWVGPTLVELYKRKEKLGPQPEQPRATYLEWNYEAELFSFGKRLGEDFDRDILKQALVHRSYVIKQENEAKEKGIEFHEMASNPQLVKEGDEIISSYLKEEFSKEHPEDVVVALHDYLTTTEMLSHVAFHMGLKDLIMTAEYPPEKPTLADTFRAIIAALKASKGLPRAQLFIKDFLICQLSEKEITDIWSPEKPLEYLTQLLKQRGVTEFEPRLCHQSATNTILANYQVGLYNEKKLLGIGWGESIQLAKETAALDAIQRIYYER